MGPCDAYKLQDMTWGQGDRQIRMGTYVAFTLPDVAQRHGAREDRMGTCRLASNNILSHCQQTQPDVPSRAGDIIILPEPNKDSAGPLSNCPMWSDMYGPHCSTLMYVPRLCGYTIPVYKGVTLGYSIVILRVVLTKEFR